MHALTWYDGLLRQPNLPLEPKAQLVHPTMFMLGGFPLLLDTGVKADTEQITSCCVDWRQWEHLQPTNAILLRGMSEESTTI